LPLQIDDFQPNKNLLTLDAVRESLPKGGSINNRSASMLAAGQSLLIEPSKEQYDSTKAELLDADSREKFTLREQMIRDQIYKDSSKNLLSTLGDGTAGDDVKLQAYRGYEAIQTSVLPRTSSLDILAQESVIADSKGETPEAEAGRSRMLDSVRQVNESKRQLTSMISSLEIGRDAGAVSKITDVAEVMAPLAEWNHIDRLLRDVVGRDADQAVLLGQQKQELYEQIKKLPIEQRQAFAEQIIALVQDHDTVVLPDGNDMVELETLQRMLVDNDYSNFERWFDNATSILDIIGVGATARGAVRGGKAAAQASRVAGRGVYSPCRRRGYPS